MAQKRTLQIPLHRCWCGSETAFDECCAPILNGTTTAPTAERLMRSRYSAFVTGDTDWLRRSWHPDTRPASIELDPDQRWLGLKILRAWSADEDPMEAVVEFVARFKVAGRGRRLHEISRFKHTDSGWLYVDGIRGTTDSTVRS